MNILVTGATGLFGPYLVGALTRAGHTVRAWVRETPLPPSSAGPGVTVFRGDITREEDVARACDGMNAICHLATARGGRERFLPVNLGGLYRLLERLRRAETPPRLVHLSGDNTVPIFDYENVAPVDETFPYLFGDDEYGLSKVLEEVMAVQYVRKYHLPVTVLRSSWIMDNGRALRLCHPRRGGWKAYLTDAQKAMLERDEAFRVVPVDRYGAPLRRHVIDPRDLAEAFCWALQTDKTLGELIHIAGPGPFNYRELGEYLNRTDSQPTFDITVPDAFSFEINLAKARQMGFTPKYSIFQTVDWALAEQAG